MEKLTLKKEKIALLLVSIIITCILLILAVRSILIHKGDLIFILFILIFSTVPTFLSITYFYQDLTKRVFIDNSKKEILIKRFGKEYLIHHNEIIESFCVKVNPKKIGGKHIRFPLYKYVVIILRDRKFYITCLLCDPDNLNLILNLNCKMAYSDIPFINPFLGGYVLTTKEFEERVLEFENKYGEYSNARLVDIIKRKSGYADYAREAAMRILNKRKETQQ